LRFLPLEELPPPRAFPRGDSRATGSPVPRKSLNRARALFTPDAAGAVSRSLPGLSQDEHDYRELKTGLGIDHFEGRSYAGWHRHVTLAVLAQAFCTMLRADPKVPAPG